MYNKSDYNKFRDYINDIYSPKALGKYYFPLVVENKQGEYYMTSFARINNKVLKDIPNIELCLGGFKHGYCELIAVLGHELGHFIAWKNKESIPDKISDKCHAGKRLSKSERSAILMEERRAWKYGFQFIEDYGLEVCEDMIRYKKSCLNNYYNFTRNAVK